jgi:hypothetical protein
MPEHFTIRADVTITGESVTYTHSHSGSWEYLSEYPFHSYKVPSTRNNQPSYPAYYEWDFEGEIEIPEWPHLGPTGTGLSNGLSNVTIEMALGISLRSKWSHDLYSDGTADGQVDAFAHIESDGTDEPLGLQQFNSFDYMGAEPATGGGAVTLIADSDWTAKGDRQLSIEGYDPGGTSNVPRNGVAYLTHWLFDHRGMTAKIKGTIKLDPYWNLYWRGKVFGMNWWSEQFIANAPPNHEIWRINSYYPVNPPPGHVYTYNGEVTVRKPDLAVLLHCDVQMPVPSEGGDIGNHVSYDVGDRMYQWRAFASTSTMYGGSGGGIAIQYATKVDPIGTPAWALSTPSWAMPGGEEPCLRIDKQSKEQALWLAYTKVVSGARQVYIARTQDEGSTWEMTINVGSGSNPGLLITRDKRILVYWRSGGAIKGRIFDTLGTEMEAEFTAISSGVDDDPISVAEFVTAGGVWNVGICYTASGGITFKSSTNGKDFS